MTTNNDTDNEYTAQLLKVFATMEQPPAEPNIYISEADTYLEKIRARRQAARERLGITEEQGD